MLSFCSIRLLLYNRVIYLVVVPLIEQYSAVVLVPKQVLIVNKFLNINLRGAHRLVLLRILINLNTDSGRT